MSTRTRQKKKLIVWYVVIGIFVLIVAAFAAFLAVKAAGKNSLKNRAVSASPLTSSAMLDTETGGDGEGLISRNGVKYRFNENLYTILCMGVDVKGTTITDKAELGEGSQSDANFLLVLDSENKKISVLAIPRDTITEIDICDMFGQYFNTTETQLALQYAYGDGGAGSCQSMEKAVSNLLYNLPINAYVSIDMNAIPVVNDAVGGVTVTALEDINKGGLSVKKGQTVTLQGKQARVYVQDRDTGTDYSAYSRLMRQKQYLTAFMKQAINATKEDITLPLSLYNSITEYMITDITASEITYLATVAMGCSFSEDNFYVVPGEQQKGYIYEEYHVDEDALYDLMLEIFYIPVD